VITINFGPGETYTSLGSALAYLAGIYTVTPPVPFTQDITLQNTCAANAHTTETGASLTPPEIYAGSYTLAICGIAGHDGNPAAMNYIGLPTGVARRHMIVKGNLVIRDLGFRCLDNYTDILLHLRADYAPATILVEDCYFDGTLDVSSKATGLNTYVNAASSALILNCKFNRLFRGYITDYNGLAGYWDVQNCSFYNCGNCIVASNWTNSKVRIKNTVAMAASPSQRAFYKMGSYRPAFTNCADDDGTIGAHTGYLTPISAADFLSVDPANANFLNIDKTSQLYTAGTTSILADNDHGIEGNDRPNANGLVSIGAHEPAVTVKVPAEGMIIDAGAVYKNYGLADEVCIGATAGGNKFEIQTTYLDQGVDGGAGPVAGGRQVLRCVPLITARIVEFTPAMLSLALPGSVATPNGNRTDIARAAEIALSDYAENIALVGEVWGVGTPVVCIIQNAITDGPVELALTDGGETVTTMRFAGHYTIDDLKTDPWEIRWPMIEVEV